MTSTEPNLLVSAQLVTGTNIHGGSFKTMAKLHLDELVRGIDLVLTHGPAIADGLKTGNLRYLVAHDHATMAHNRSYRGVELYFTSRHIDKPGNDARWRVYADVLEREAARGTACAFTIDFGDVYPTTWALHELCQQRPGALFLASDSCRHRHVWAWLDWSRRASNFSASAVLDARLLKSGDGRLPYNCGVMGGSAAVLLSAIRDMAWRIEVHYRSLAARGLGHGMIVDMLTMFEMLEQSPPAAGVVTGFPSGPVNLPMHGDFCYGLAQCQINRSYPYFNRTDCNRLELAEMTRTHFFRHKLGCGRTIPCGRGAPMVLAPPPAAPAATSWHDAHLRADQASPVLDIILAQRSNGGIGRRQ